MVYGLFCKKIKKWFYFKGYFMVFMDLNYNLLKRNVGNGF